MSNKVGNNIESTYQVKELISLGSLDKAISIFLEITKDISEFHNQAISLSARINKLNNEEAKGILEFDKIEITRNRITDDLLNTIDEYIETKKKTFETSSDKIASLADKLAKAENEIEEKRKRKQLLSSQEGLTLAFEEVKKIKSIISICVEEVKSKTKQWHLMSRPNKHNEISIMSYGYYLSFQFYHPYTPYPENSYLSVKLFKGYFDENGKADIFNENILKESVKLKFDINELNQKGWSLLESDNQFSTSKKLVENWFDKLIKFATKERSEKNY